MKLAYRLMEIDRWAELWFDIKLTVKSFIRHNVSQNLNVSHLVLQLSLCNILKPGVKSRMKIGAQCS